MPEMRFRIRWPDGEGEECYSPSLIVKDYLSPGETYAVDDFLVRSRAALTIASERVKAKFGFACSSATDQLARIEAGCRRFAHQGGGRVRVETFYEEEQVPP
jgi:uncharacterized repeat protein (TIGR04042 family)